MGLMDHRSTHRYEVKAAPQDCIAAFARAFSGRAGVAGITKAHWKVQRVSDGAVAAYEGRGGLGLAGAILSQRQDSEQQAAIGSAVTFTVESSGDGVSTCAMWLSSRGTILGVFTSDARFIRPYMQGVLRHLQELDPQVRVAKD